MEATTIKQGLELIKIGIDKETADMHYWEAEGKEYLYVGKCSDINGTPAWSLGALVNLFPVGNDKPTFNLTRGGWNPKMDRHVDDWFAEYENEGSIKNHFWITAKGKTATDAVVKLMKTLKKEKIEFL